MLPTIEEQESKILEIFNEFTKLKSFKITEPYKQYAKWYVEQVVKHCAEVAKCEFWKINEDFDETDLESVEEICVSKRILFGDDYKHSSNFDSLPSITVDTQSILNVINDL